MLHHVSERAGRGLGATIAAFALAASITGCTHQAGSEAAFCREVKQVPALSTVLEGYRNASPDELKARLASTRAEYAALAHAAPAEIHGDVAQVVTLVDAVIDAVAAHPTDQQAIAGDLRKQVAAHPGASAATTAMGAYTSAHCHVDLGTGTNGSTSTAPTGPTGSTTTTSPGVTAPIGKGG